MPISVTIKVRDNGTFAYLKNLPEHVRKIGKREVWNLTQYGASQMIKSAIMNGITNWKGNLLKYGKGIMPVKISECSYGISFPLYGLALDRMKPHWVSLKRNRTITKWASSPEKLNKKRGSVYVKPHPYITGGYLKMLMRLDTMANKIVREI